MIAGPIAPGPAPRGLLRRNGPALIATGAVTLGGIIAASLLVGGSEGGLRSGVLLALGASAVWVSVAAPLLGARGRTVLETLLRGGMVIDAAGVGLLCVATVMAIRGQEGFSLLDALQAYCVLLAVGLAQLGVVSLGRSETARFTLALIAAAGVIGMLATPFWAEGVLQAASTAGSLEVAAFATRWNPFYSLAAAVRYPWNYAGWMYTITGLGENVPAPRVYWYSAALRYALVSAVAWLGVAVARLIRRRRDRVRTG